MKKRADEICDICGAPGNPRHFNKYGTRWWCGTCANSFHALITLREMGGHLEVLRPGRRSRNVVMHKPPVSFR
jgi:hypothetical protein